MNNSKRSLKDKFDELHESLFNLLQNNEIINPDPINRLIDDIESQVNDVSKIESDMDSIRNEITSPVIQRLNEANKRTTVSVYIGIFGGVLAILTMFINLIPFSSDLNKIPFNAQKDWKPYESWKNDTHLDNTIAQNEESILKSLLYESAFNGFHKERFERPIINTLLLYLNDSIIYKFQAFVGKRKEEEKPEFYQGAKNTILNAVSLRKEIFYLDTAKKSIRLAPNSIDDNIFTTKDYHVDEDDMVSILTIEKYKKTKAPGELIILDTPKNSNKTKYCEFSFYLKSHKEFSNIRFSEFNISNSKSFEGIPLKFNYKFSKNGNRKNNTDSPQILLKAFQILDSNMNSRSMDTNLVFMESILDEINSSNCLNLNKFSDIDSLLREPNSISFHQAPIKSPLAVTFKWD